MDGMLRSKYFIIIIIQSKWTWMITFCQYAGTVSVFNAN